MYRDIITERVRFAVSSARAAAQLEHRGVKGALRESLIADLFRPLLPADFGLATGILISNDDQQSAQQDIVVFDRRVLPPLLFQGPAIIPIECALATIEVKSCLTAAELRKAQANVITVRNLPILSGVRNERGEYVDPFMLDAAGKSVVPRRLQTASPASSVFALDSDLIAGGKTELERHAEVCSDDPHVLRAMCIVGRGLFGPTRNVVFDNATRTYESFDSEPITADWVLGVSADEHHAEVVAFVSFIYDVLARISEGRGRPPLSSYLNSQLTNHRN